MKLDNKLIHIVGGGINQIPLVKKAKELGLKVLLTDMYAEPPAKKYCDFFEQMDVTDKEETLKIAKRYSIDAIATDQVDVAVSTVAYVAEVLELAGIGYTTALKFTNKHIMRDELIDKVSCIPKYIFFKDIEEIKEQINSLPTPYIIKPINSQGSKGVYILTRYEEEKIVSSFKESRGAGILVEEYIQGEEVAVESYTCEGKSYLLSISRKVHYDTNDCIDKSVKFFADISPELEQTLILENAKVIKSLGLVNGICHAEFRLKNNKPYLMEIAVRGAGGNINSLIIPYLTGFDSLQAIIFNAFGIHYIPKINDYKANVALLEFFDYKAGKLKNLDIDRKTIKENSKFFMLNLHVGDTINTIKDSRDRVGYFIVCGSDKESVIAKAKLVKDAIYLEYVTI